MRRPITRWQTLEEGERKRKIHQFLMARGFSYDTIEEYVAIAAGAMAGVFVPASLFILLGFVRQRYRYSEDTEADLAAHIPLLGILPEHSMKDPAQNPV